MMSRMRLAIAGMFWRYLRHTSLQKASALRPARTSILRALSGSNSEGSSAVVIVQDVRIRGSIRP
jgi:hypothetical protein